MDRGFKIPRFCVRVPEGAVRVPTP
jgi:hypothetical protein